MLAAIVSNGQRADVEAADAAAQLAAEVERHQLSRVADAEPTGEERSAVLLDAPELKDVDVLQKKVAPFGKEQAEAREVYLAVVDFRRGEIGVQCERCVELRRDLVEHVDGRLDGGFRRGAGDGAPVADADGRHDVEALALLDL